jgi:NAD(P)-dependent dehydrogenase (short-subunit alcohol dehydrogenase family)
VPSTQQLTGQCAFVTGAARGIGRASAQRLAADGARVLLVDSDADGLAEAAEAIGSPAHVLDVTDADAWPAAIAEAERVLGHLSILVNAAGILTTGSIFETSLEDWRRTMAVNLDGVYLGCRTAVPALRRAGGGSIVNIASTSGIRADGRSTAYDASKAGVRSLTKEVAVSCARRGYGIRCNSVHPGAVDTEMLRGLASSDPELHRDWADHDALPMGRHAQPAEIAAMVAFLASPRAAFITGAEYVIDGGATL